MGTPTYTPIANFTLSTDAVAMEITSIDQSFTHLVVIIEGYVTARTGQYVTINGDATDANYGFVYAYGTGSSAISGSGAYRGTNEVFENSSTNRTLMCMEFIEYSSVNKHKNILIRADNASPNGTEMRVMKWANTSSPITSISLSTTGSASWGSGTSFALYGII